MIDFEAVLWQREGSCFQKGNMIFFVEKGKSVRRAKAVCRECPVKTQCLEYAHEKKIPFGVWGGLTAKERERQRREEKEEKTPQLKWKKCNKCGKKKRIEKYPVRSDNGSRRGICGDCYRASQKKYHRARRKQAG